MADSVGGPIYIGDTPGGESLPENDSTIDNFRSILFISIISFILS